MGFLIDRTTYCAKCHLLGDYNPGEDVKITLAPKLDQVARRIRPDHLRRWLANPKSVLPYTAMPVNFPVDKEIGQEIFRGESREQLDAVMDLLLHYDGYMRGRISISKDGRGGIRGRKGRIETKSVETVSRSVGTPRQYRRITAEDAPATQRKKRPRNHTNDTNQACAKLALFYSCHSLNSWFHNLVA